MLARAHKLGDQELWRILNNVYQECFGRLCIYICIHNVSTINSFKLRSFPCSPCESLLVCTPWCRVSA